MADYTLPELPYDYAALEPHLSGQILELHHDKHHAGYVSGANATKEKLTEARANDDFASINQLQKNLAFNVSGHVLHSLFWQNMSPDAGGKPEGELAAAVDEAFGSFDALRSQLTQAALGVQGSGWGALSWDPTGGSLVVEQTTTTRQQRCSRERRSSSSTCGSTRSTCSTRSQGRLGEGVLERRQLAGLREAPVAAPDRGLRRRRAGCDRTPPPRVLSRRSRAAGRRPRRRRAEASILLRRPRRRSRRATRPHGTEALPVPLPAASSRAARVGAGRVATPPAASRPRRQQEATSAPAPSRAIRQRGHPTPLSRDLGPPSLITTSPRVGGLEPVDLVPALSRATTPGWWIV